MNFEFTPCVLRPNAEAAPVYGLLIRPVNRGTAAQQPPQSLVVVQNSSFRSAGEVGRNPVHLVPSQHQPQPILPAVSGSKILLPQSSAPPKTSAYSVATSSACLASATEVDFDHKTGFSSPVFVPASTVQHYQESRHGSVHVSETQAAQVVPQLAPEYRQREYNHSQQLTQSYQCRNVAGNAQPCFLPSNGAGGGHGSDSRMPVSQQSVSSASAEITSLLDDIEPTFTHDFPGEYADIGRILAESESILSPDSGFLDGAMGEPGSSNSSGRHSYMPLPTAQGSSTWSQSGRLEASRPGHSIPYTNYSCSSGLSSSVSGNDHARPSRPAPVSGVAPSPVRHACRFQNEIKSCGNSLETSVPRPQLEWERAPNETSGTPDSGIQSIAGSPHGAVHSPISPPTTRPYLCLPNRAQTLAVQKADIQQLAATRVSKDVQSTQKNTKKSKKHKTPIQNKKKTEEFEDMPTLVAESGEVGGEGGKVDSDSAPELASPTLSIPDRVSSMDDKFEQVCLKVLSGEAEKSEGNEENTKNASVPFEPYVTTEPADASLIVDKLLSTLRPDQLRLFTKLFDGKLGASQNSAENSMAEKKRPTKEVRKRSRRTCVSEMSDKDKSKRDLSPPPEQEENFAGYVSDTSSSVSTPSEHPASTSTVPPPVDSKFCADITKDPLLLDLSVSQQRSRSWASRSQKGPHTVSVREKKMLMKLQEFRSRGRNILDLALIEHVLDLAGKLQRLTVSEQNSTETISKSCFFLDWSKIDRKDLSEPGPSDQEKKSFDNLTNLEIEAESSDEERNDIGEDTHAEDPCTFESQKYVEIKKSSEGRKISLKIRLGSFPSSNSVVIADPEKEPEDKKRKACDSKTLPPKKRIKEQLRDSDLFVAHLKVGYEEEQAGQKDSVSTAKKKSRKRRKSHKNPWDRTRVKKKPPLEGVAKNALIRRCKECGAWLRVQTGPNADLSRFCSSCLQSGGATGTTESNKNHCLKQCKVILRKLPTRRRGFWRLKNSDTEEKILPMPRKKYRRSGDFDESPPRKESADALVVTKDSCTDRIQPFHLPYDLWWDFYYFPQNPSSRFTYIRSNIYLDQPPRSPSQPNVCSCSISVTDACGDNCLNRMMLSECQPGWCPCGDFCTNQRFQKREWIKCLKRFHTGTERGFGVVTERLIKKGTFICEYVGEVVSAERFWERMRTVYKDSVHHYALNLSSGSLIDSYRCGSIARFVNHSCEPCCEMQKWWVNGSYRVGLFALRDVESGEELTYDYKFHAFRSQQKCFCGSPGCRGTIGSVSSASVEKQSPSRKPDIMKPVTQKERTLVCRRRLFLPRNIRKVRRIELNRTDKRKIFKAEEKRKEPDVKEFIMALRNSRTVRTRRFACVSENEPLIRVAQLAQVLNSMFAAVMNCRLENGDKLSEVMLKDEKLEEIRKQILSGYYKDPNDFDEAMTSLIVHVKTVFGKEVAACATKSFSKVKQDSVEQLRDVLKYQLSSKYVSQADSSRLTNSSVLITTRADTSYLDEDFSVGCYDPDATDGVWQKRADECYPNADLVRCVCGIAEEDGTMLQCDKCLYWQHGDCVQASAEGTYLCYFCLKSVERVPSLDIVQIPQPEIRLERCTYYRTLVNRNKLQVRIGESVYTRRIDDEAHKEILKQLEESCTQGSENPRNSSKASDIPVEKWSYSKKDLRIFRVERLFTGPNGRKFVFGFYYARPHETFCEPTRRFYKNELFCTPMYNTLPLDVVIGRCLVLDSQTYSKGRPRFPCYQDEDVFICDYRVDKNQRFFEKIGPKNRYPINTEPYMFRFFPQRLKIKREFSPFIFPAENQGLEKSRQISESADEDVPLHEIKSTILRRKRLEKRTRLERLMDSLVQSKKSTR